MQIIKAFKGNTYITTLYTKILVDEPNCKSSASLILLNNYYKQLDESYLKIRRYKLIYSRKRKKFLNDKLKKDGYLECHYCHKRHLEYDTKNKLKLVTIDHIKPKKDLRNYYLDNTNWVVCCSYCNNDKRRTSYKKYIKNAKMLRRREINDNVNLKNDKKLCKKLCKK